MTHNTDTQVLLFQVRLLLDEGKNEDALSTLRDIRAEDALYEEAVYLTGRAFAQLKQWTQSIQTLLPIISPLDPPVLRMLSPERERMTLCLLYLGLAAMKLQHYEEASRHLTYCLKVLHDRRVHLPAVRIRTRSSLAQACILRGLYTNAVIHYDEALRLCQRYNDPRELPAIYYGLGNALYHSGDLTRAEQTTQEALRLYRECQNYEQEARALSLLAHIFAAQKAHSQAVDYYQQAAHLACKYGNSSIAIENYLALVDLSLKHNLETARQFAEKALAKLKQPHNLDLPLTREIYRLVGKLRQEEALTLPEPDRRSLLEEAISWYARAAEQADKSWDVARAISTYEDWARALEALGRPEEALKRWQSAYALASSGPRLRL